MKFENSWVIAGVRGTSVAIQWDNITIYQSQGLGGFAKYRPDNVNSQTIDLSKCSSFNVKSHNTRNLFPQNTNRYCLSGNNDTILNFTKKDLIYLNELINNNNADEKILQEKNIIAPQEIQPSQTFCPDQTKTIFWPNVTNIQDMCQEENVVAVATLTPKEDKAKIVYKVGNEAKEKKITIKKNPNNSDYYGGTLEINNELQSILSNSKVKISSNNAIDSNNTLLLYNTDHTYSLGCPHIPNRPVIWHCGDGWLGIIKSQDISFGQSIRKNLIFNQSHDSIKIIFWK